MDRTLGRRRLLALAPAAGLALKAAAMDKPALLGGAKVRTERFEAWLVVGSQHLYGEDALREVAEHARRVANELESSEGLPVRVVFKSVLTSPEAILQLCQ